MYQSGNKILLGFLLCCMQAAHAEDADRDKPIHLEADQVLVDDAHQTSTFTGNVHLTQGTLLIQGDRIVVEQGKEGFKRAMAYGEIASFRQKMEGSESYVEGYGERIEYDAGAGLMDIYGQARIRRGQDEVRGPHITYNTKSEIFQVEGEGATGTPDQRVRAVLQPKASRELTAPAAGPANPIPGNTPHE